MYLQSLEVSKRLLEEHLIHLQATESNHRAQLDRARTYCSAVKRNLDDLDMEIAEPADRDSALAFDRLSRRITAIQSHLSHSKAHLPSGLLQEDVQTLLTAQQAQIDVLLSEHRQLDRLLQSKHERLCILEARRGDLLTELKTLEELRRVEEQEFGGALLALERFGAYREAVRDESIM